MRGRPKATFLWVSTKDTYICVPNPDELGVDNSLVGYFFNHHSHIGRNVQLLVSCIIHKEPVGSFFKQKYDSDLQWKQNLFYLGVKNQKKILQYNLI